MTTLSSEALKGGAARGIGRVAALALAGADVVGRDVCAVVSSIAPLPRPPRTTSTEWAGGLNN